MWSTNEDRRRRPRGQVARAVRPVLGWGAAILLGAGLGLGSAAAASSSPGAPGQPAAPGKQHGQRHAKTEHHAITKTATTKSARRRAAKNPAKAAPLARGEAAGAAAGLPFSHGRSAKVVPNQAGKIVVFPFRNDDRDAVSTQVGQLLAVRGLEIMNDVKPVDTAEQYRDMAGALGVVAYIDGDVKGGDDSLRATVRLRSGFSGRKVSQTTFSESRANLPRELSDRLWTKLGPAMAHACLDAAKPRKKSRTTLQINAGTPIETVPAAAPVPPSRRTSPSANDPAPGPAPAKAAGPRSSEARTEAGVTTSGESA